MKPLCRRNVADSLVICHLKTHVFTDYVVKFVWKRCSKQKTLPPRQSDDYSKNGVKRVLSNEYRVVDKATASTVSLRTITGCGRKGCTKIIIMGSRCRCRRDSEKSVGTGRLSRRPCQVLGIHRIIDGINDLPNLKRWLNWWTRGFEKKYRMSGLSGLTSCQSLWTRLTASIMGIISTEFCCLFIWTI